jgi:hypothetical protein
MGLVSAINRKFECAKCGKVTTGFYDGTSEDTPKCCEVSMMAVTIKTSHSTCADNLLTP